MGKVDRLIISDNTKVAHDKTTTNEIFSSANGLRADGLYQNVKRRTLRTGCAAHSYLMLLVLIDVEVVPSAADGARVHLDCLPVGVHVVVPDRGRHDIRFSGR